MKIITTVSITNEEIHNAENIVYCDPCQAIDCKDVDCVDCPLCVAARNLREAQEVYIAKLKEIPIRNEE